MGRLQSVESDVKQSSKWANVWHRIPPTLSVNLPSVLQLLQLVSSPVSQNENFPAVLLLQDNPITNGGLLNFLWLIYFILLR